MGLSYLLSLSRDDVEALVERHARAMAERLFELRARGTFTQPDDHDHSPEWVKGFTAGREKGNG